MRSHALPPVLAVAALVGSTEAGAAEPAAESDAIAVLPVVIAGELPKPWREQLQARLREGIERGDRPVVVAARDCPEPAATCLREIGAEQGARWIARARVGVQERDFAIALELYDGRTGQSVTATEGTCEVCAIAEAGDMLADYAGVIDRKLDALAHAPPVIRFESRPSGALVYLDGELLGK